MKEDTSQAHENTIAGAFRKSYLEFTISSNHILLLLVILSYHLIQKRNQSLLYALLHQ